MIVRAATPADWPDLWPILREAFAAGDTYAFAEDTTEQEARRVWLEAPSATFLAEVDGQVLGTYYLKPNQPGRGSHVGNAGYIVSARARGRGIGRALAEHSLAAASTLGFAALQFNLVVSTNASALHLWRDLGFEVVGTLPQAFDHAQLGRVDAHVLYRLL